MEILSWGRRGADREEKKKKRLEERTPTVGLYMHGKRAKIQGWSLSGRLELEME